MNFMVHKEIIYIQIETKFEFELKWPRIWNSFWLILNNFIDLNLEKKYSKAGNKENVVVFIYFKVKWIIFNLLLN